VGVGGAPDWHHSSAALHVSPPVLQCSGLMSMVAMEAQKGCSASVMPVVVRDVVCEK